MSTLELINTVINKQKVKWVYNFSPLHFHNQPISNNFFDSLEENVINYKFKDKSLLIEAFNIKKMTDS